MPVTGHRNYTITAAVVLAGLMTVGATGGPAHAYSAMENYIPPEITYASDLRQTVTVDERIDINRGGLNQLRLLPGFDDNLALKVMRHRPLADFQDFYKLPGLSKKEIDRLIDQLQPLIIFK